MKLSGLNSGVPRQVEILPTPDADACAHSLRLKDQIRDEIASNNDHISFKRYMELTLYEPGLGYYSAGVHKFGQQGDFITAPELSVLFSHCLARQCEQVLNNLRAGWILELGAGSGTMACDLLQALAKMNCLPEKYLILEVSADLRQRQQQLVEQRIPEYSSRMEWLGELPARPFKGLIIANEVIDAMPVHRIRVNANSIEELHVACEGDTFKWSRVPADSALIKHIEDIFREGKIEWPDNYITEVNTDLKPWLAGLSDCLEQGVMLFIDYGYPCREYYHPQRSEGTLLCHYRHRVHADPFFYPGLQDITASVDFSAVAKAADAAGLDIAGFTSQAHFLISCGLDEVISTYAGNDPKSYLEISRQAKLLTLPAEMGERFKVIAASRKLPEKLIGFNMADHRDRL